VLQKGIETSNSSLLEETIANLIRVLTAVHLFALGDMKKSFVEEQKNSTFPSE